MFWSPALGVSAIVVAIGLAGGFVPPSWADTLVVAVNGGYELVDRSTNREIRFLRRDEVVLIIERTDGADVVAGDTNLLLEHLDRLSDTPTTLRDTDVPIIERRDGTYALMQDGAGGVAPVDPVEALPAIPVLPEPRQRVVRVAPEPATHDPDNDRRPRVRTTSDDGRVGSEKGRVVILPLPPPPAAAPAVPSGAGSQ